MSIPDEKKPVQSKTVQICALVCVVIGVAAFQAMAPSLFPRPRNGGFNVEQTIGAAVVGGVCGLIGFGIGKLIDALRKPHR